jgi:hypothetical protein
MWLSKYWMRSSPASAASRIFRSKRGRVTSLAAVSVLILIGANSMASSRAAGADKISGKISVRDAVTVPGRAVMLEARLVQEGLLRQTGIGGEQLEFMVAGRKIGTAMTGGDGRALLEYTPRMRGNQAVTVKTAESRRVENSEGAATVFTWERRRPILLIELAALVEESKAPTIPLPPLQIGTGANGPMPVADAAVELKRMTDFYFNVVYVSRSGHQEMGETGDTRDWLRQHRFPPGLFITLSAGPSALANEIQELRQEGWDNVKAGVGRTPEFAEVLVEHRIQVLIVPPKDRAELPKKSDVAKDWKEVRKKLQG